MQDPRHKPQRSQLRRPTASSLARNVRASDASDADVTVLRRSDHLALGYEHRSLSILHRLVRSIGACVLAVDEVRQHGGPDRTTILTINYGSLSKAIGWFGTLSSNFGPC